MNNELNIDLVKLSQDFEKAKQLAELFLETLTKNALVEKQIECAAKLGLITQAFEKVF